jgi:hypothetical protein
MTSSAFPAHHMKCRRRTLRRGDGWVLPPVALYRLIGGFSGVTPHNHVDRIAASDQRIYTFAKPRDDLHGGRLPHPIRSTSVNSGARGRQRGIGTISGKMASSSLFRLTISSVSGIPETPLGQHLMRGGKGAQTARYHRAQEGGRNAAPSRRRTHPPRQEQPRHGAGPGHADPAPHQRAGKACVSWQVQGGPPRSPPGAQGLRLAPHLLGLTCEMPSRPGRGAGARCTRT